MVNILRNAGNPQMLFQKMLSQNPMLKQVMEYINNNGGDAEQAFYKMAKEQGVNPEDILKQLR